MSGLVGYGSSDEDSENEPTKTEDLKPSVCASSDVSEKIYQEYTLMC